MFNGVIDTVLFKKIPWSLLILKSIFFYGWVKLQFSDVDVNPGPRAVPQCCRVMLTNINVLHGNRDELAIAATKFGVVACADTKVSDRTHVSNLLLPGFKTQTLLLKGMALFVPSGLSVSLQESFECSCCEFMVAMIPGQWLNCCLFVVYRSPSTDDRVFDCLCEAMGSIQSVDSKSVFCFVRDFNCHHSEWLGSLMAMVWVLLTLPLLLTVLDWLMEVCWILFWQMFRIYMMCMFMVLSVGRTKRRLALHCIYHRLLLDSM